MSSHGHEAVTGTEIKEGYEIVSILFGSKIINYTIGIVVHILLCILIITVLHLFLDFIPYNWWILLACIFIGIGWLEDSLVEVEKTERLLITFWKDPCAVISAGRWYLPFSGWLFDCNPEHTTDIQLQETAIKPIIALSTDKIKMTGSGIVNWKIVNSSKFMMINETIMNNNLQKAAQAELQETIISNKKIACIEANKTLRTNIKEKNTQLHEIAEEYGVEIVACVLVIEQSVESMNAEEKIAIEKAEAEVLRTEKTEFLNLKNSFMESGISALEAAQLALAVMGKGSSYSFIGSAGDFTKGAAIKK